MKVKKGQQIDLEISDVAFGGKGLSKVDGLTVFVKQAVPGDKLTARIVKKKKRFAAYRFDWLGMFQYRLLCVSKRKQRVSAKTQHPR